jgi:hypothetical protein
MQPRIFSTSLQRVLGTVAGAADSPFSAILLSAVYPAVFFLSLNWYALRTGKIVFVLLTTAAVALMAYLFIKFAVWTLFTGLSLLGGLGRYVDRKSTVTLLLTALVCSVIFFFFMYAALESLLTTSTFQLLCLLALTSLIVWLSLNRMLRYWTAILTIMTLTSLATWVQSIVAATATERSLIRTPFNVVRFKHRPNIYLIVYDAYGNRRLYHDVYGVDNAAIYQELAARNFKVLDTYSNYWGSFDSMLSVFLGKHHYYDLMAGISDSRIGRWILNGTTFNPTFTVLKDNGYKVQYIEATEYLVEVQGNLDYAYPGGSEPLYTGLRVFNNPLLNRIPSLKRAGPKPLEGYVSTMTEVFFNRLAQTIKGGVPWFTYIHFPLPAHASGPFLSLHWWEKIYRENTRKANVHMLATIDKILAVDPDALIIIMGDHGSYRYNEAWKGADNPNDAFKAHGLDSDVMTVDYFGILMAIRSRDQCNDLIYENLTPVNLMRVIFSCLSGDRNLLYGRVADISIFPYFLSMLDSFPSALYMAVKDGKILKPWVKIQRPRPPW